MVGVVVFGPASLLAESDSVPTAIMPEKHFAVLEKYCLDCHDAATEKGKVNLEDLSFDLGSLETAELWQKVLNSLNSGEMPPEDKKQVSAGEKTLFLDDLSHQLVTARKILSDSGGAITMRRLNRREYKNTIRDLLGVDVDVADLPDDAGSGGFDTAGGSLFFSSDQLERYLTLGRKALDSAMVPIPIPSRPETRKVRIEAETEANKRITGILRGYHMGGYRKYMMWKASKGRPASDFGLVDDKEMAFRKLAWDRNAPQYIDYLTRAETKTGALLTIGGNLCPQVPAVIPDEMPAGNYKLRAHIGTMPKMPSERTFVEIGYRGDRIDGAMDLIDCRKVSGTVAKPQTIEFDLTLRPPKNPLKEDVGTETKKVVMLGDRVVVFRERQPNVRGSNVYRNNLAREQTGFGVEPALWIDWVEWEGPIYESKKEWPPKSHREIFFQGSDAELTDAYVRKIIERFAGRAFRGREASAAFIDKLMAQYSDQIARDVPAYEAIKAPLAVILASPAFLYLAEPAGEEKRRELTDLEMAVRLSYFLWSSPPDEELNRVAREGKLKHPAVLSEQTTRLLADPRSWEFVSGFTHQWLTMDRLDFFQYNYRLYPEFDDSIKRAARAEVYHTIDQILRENRSIGELLKSDTVVINDVLADFYDIPGVKGDTFRRVKVPKDHPRGGLLGTVAVLAMGSDGERSSPVERGSWVMRKLLNDPPPPAPANVPQLSRHAGKLFPARELLLAHMEEAQCAQCHRKIDPIGYGLENFNAAGQWRETEYTEIAAQNRVKKSKEHPIDASGTLPDGTKFVGFYELRDQIAKQEDAFARGFTEALIAYGLGRPFGFSDYDLAEEILAGAKTNENRMNQFVHALVKSKPFRMK